MANLSLAAAALTLAACSATAPPQPFHPPVPGPSASETPSAFDNKSNGVVDDSTHEADQTTFDEVQEGQMIRCAAGLLRPAAMYGAVGVQEHRQRPPTG